jgi:hypothetical protein
VIRPFLLRGLICGLLAGLIAGCFAFLLGEPVIERAISFEERLAASSGEHHDRGSIGRDGQRVGLFLATGLYGMAVGGLFGLVFATLRGRVRIGTDRSLAVFLAGVVLLAGVLVPFLKYPANPPAVGDPKTITERTLLYCVMAATSLLSLVAGWRVVRGLGRHRCAWLPKLAGGLVSAAGAAAAFVLLPGVDEVPAGFPGDVLRDFRWVALGVQVVLWSSLGILFAWMLNRDADQTFTGNRPDGLAHSGSSSSSPVAGNPDVATAAPFSGFPPSPAGADLRAAPSVRHTTCPEICPRLQRTPPNSTDLNEPKNAQTS